MHCGLRAGVSEYKHDMVGVPFLGKCRVRDCPTLGLPNQRPKNRRFTTLARVIYRMASWGVLLEAFGLR